MTGSDGSGPGLAVDGLTVRIGSNVVLDAIDLAVAPGTVISVMGPNGSGKSTLLRAIAGLVPIERGRIAVAGREVTAVPTYRRGVAMVFQSLALFDHLDVARNVGFGLRFGDRRTSRADRRARVRSALEAVRLAGFEHRSVSTLSGGERQRVALARSLAPSPRVLLLDEAFSAVDRVARSEVLADLRVAVVGRGIATVHVTHDTIESQLLGAVSTLRLEGRAFDREER